MDKLIILFNYYQYLFIVKSKQRYYNNNNTIAHNGATILPRIVSNLTDLLDPCLFLGGTNFAWPRKPVRRTRFKVIEKDSILWMKEEEKKNSVPRTLQFHRVEETTPQFRGLQWRHVRKISWNRHATSPFERGGLSLNNAPLQPPDWKVLYPTNGGTSCRCASTNREQMVIEEGAWTEGTEVLRRAEDTGTGTLLLAWSLNEANHWTCSFF